MTDSDTQAPHSINIAGYAHQEAVTYAEWLRAGNSTGELSDHAIEGLEKHFVHVIRHTLSVRLGDLEINPPETHLVGMDEEDRTPVPEGLDAAQWRKADEVHHAMALVASDTECVKILYAALAAEADHA